MKIPLNRVVAFLGPYISLLAGAAAAWLVAKLNVLGIPGLDQANTATWLAGALSLGLTAGLSHLGQMKWLKGVHIELENEGKAAAAALSAPSASTLLSGEPIAGVAGSLLPSEPVVGATYMGNGEWFTPGEGDTSDLVADALVSDDQEFASPPPGTEQVRPEAGRVPDAPPEPPAVGG